MKYLHFIILLMAVVISAGCTGGNQNPVVTPTPQIVYVTVLGTPSPTTMMTTKTPVPTATPIPVSELKITDGFWCRDTTRNIGKDPTTVRECYQFFTDGTYKWGYSPGWPMGKSASCPGDPSAKCTYSIGPTGKYEVEGGYSFILSGDTIVDPHDPPHFTWTSTGIP
jgi:hypothetical protein